MPEKSVYILCIETANAVTSVAVAKDNACLLVKNIVESNKAADKLHRLVEELLSEATLSFTALDAIAVSAGPGSYTGLRIAAAAAKGYCFALNIPLISVATLQAMVEGAIGRYHQNNYAVYVPMIDARRMEVFTSFFDKTNECQQYFSSLVIDETSKTLFQPEKQYLIFGNGAAKVYPIIASESVTLFSDFIPSAEDLCKLSFEKYKSAAFEDIAYFEPSYYKAFHSTQKSQ